MSGAQSNSIDVGNLLTVTPSVIAAGGTALDLIGYLLTSSSRIPYGTPYVFPSFAAVSAFFGPSAPETAAAATYFNGFDNSNKKPGSIGFWQYNVAAIGSIRYCGSLAGVSLNTIITNATLGTMAITMGATLFTSSAINISAATSFTQIATIIQAAFTAPTFTVSYDSVSQSFRITSTVTGTAAPLVALVGGTSNLSGILKMIGSQGAFSVPGAAAATPATSMSALVTATRNFISYTTIFEPVLADKLNFAIWNNSMGNRYLYVPWDTDVTAAQQGATTSFGFQLQLAGYVGVSPVWESFDKAMFVLGSVASIDFTELNGRVTLAYRGQSGLIPDVYDELTASTLLSNGYNFYGDYSTANQDFKWFQPGSVSGPYDWIDSYVNQVWFSNQLQLALAVYFTAVKSIPYNLDGYTGLEAALFDPIKQALDFGAIRAGVTLSASQISQVNASAGVPIDGILSTRGWYLQIRDALPQVRQVRQSPPATLWYMDGGSIQSINLASIEVQ